MTAAIALDLIPLLLGRQCTPLSLQLKEKRCPVSFEMVSKLYDILRPEKKKAIEHENWNFLKIYS